MDYTSSSKVPIFLKDAYAKFRSSTWSSTRKSPSCCFPPISLIDKKGSLCWSAVSKLNLLDCVLSYTT